jgi:hypothetical protein
MAMVLGIVGGLISAVGTIAGGVAQANALRYQAQVAHNNAIIAQQTATRSLEAGRIASENKSLQEAEQGGAIKAAQAAGGVDVNTGSNVEVQKSHRIIGALDTATVMSNAEMQAYGYRVQGYNQEAQAGLDTAEAKQAEIGGVIGGVGQAFGAASKWFGPGAFGSTG